MSASQIGLGLTVRRNQEHFASTLETRAKNLVALARRIFWTAENRLPETGRETFGSGLDEPSRFIFRVGIIEKGSVQKHFPTPLAPHIVYTYYAPHFSLLQQETCTRMAPKPKHRLSPVKIPIELNHELEECREHLGHTHTQAIEEAVRLYVQAAKKRKREAERNDV
jgi:hypothetical protein